MLKKNDNILKSEAQKDIKNIIYPLSIFKTFELYSCFDSLITI